MEKDTNNETGEMKETGGLIEFRYHPGYCDMNGGHHSECLKKGETGEWVIECDNRDSFEEPEIKTIYSVNASDEKDFEAFIRDKNVASLMNNKESDEFVTDYSPWSYGMVFAEDSSKTKKRIYVDFDQYKEYSDEDYELIKELYERFEALKGEVLSEEVESSRS